jgi:2-methylcitrate dehydratase PrpD
MEPITREIARRVAETRFDDLPADVVDYSKTLAMSALGAMVAGPSCPGSDIVTGYVRRAGGAAEATVLGGGFRAPVEAAALANATYAHATEYEDDSFPEAVSSYTLFPAIFALGERLGSDGRDVIAAFVVGYETQARIGLACREARRLGYMVLALAGAIGCAASAARLLRLDAARTTNAISLAASQGSGIGCQTGSMAHIVEMGFAARNGLTAALLAADGFTGQPDVLEAPRGLFNIITAGKVESTDDILGKWGRPYRVLEVGIKQYPCCYHLQRIIESTVELRDEGRIAPETVDEVEVEVNAFFPTVVQHPEPHDEIEAQFSLPHAVASSLLEPRVLPASFSKGRIEAPQFRDLRQRVRMVVREDWGWTPTGWTPRIRYRLRDGTEIVREPQRSRGQPPELLGFDECVAKYRGCVDAVLGQKEFERSVAILRALEHCRDVRELMRAVGTPRGAT